MIASISMPVENGIVAIVAGEMRDIVNGSEISYDVMTYGILISTAALQIPVPEVLLNHLLKTGTISVYLLEAESYIAQLIQVISLDLTSLAEARGVYQYIKQQERKKKTEQAEPVSV